LNMDAWPGQSVNVSRNRSVSSAENCKSIVMPRSCDCGFLSSAAVDKMLLRVAHRLVLAVNTTHMKMMKANHVCRKHTFQRRRVPLLQYSLCFL
jgi:hypothetical protein